MVAVACVRCLVLSVLVLRAVGAPCLLIFVPATHTSGHACRYVVDQILVLRICRKPPTFSVKAFSFSIFTFQLLPFLWLLLMVVVYFSPAKFGPREPDATLPVLSGYIIWAVALLTPLQHWMGINKPPKDVASRDARFGPWSPLHGKTEPHALCKGPVPGSITVAGITEPHSLSTCMPCMHGGCSIKELKLLYGTHNHHTNHPPRQAEPSSCVCSYLSLVQHAHSDSSRSMSAALSSPAQRPRVAWQPEVYCPSIPAQCSSDYAKMVLDSYRLRVPPVPENTQLMAGQRPENGGMHARPPASAPARVPSTVRAMFVRAAPPTHPRAGEPGMSMAAADLTAAMFGGY